MAKSNDEITSASATGSIATTDGHNGFNRAYRFLKRKMKTRQDK